MYDFFLGGKDNYAPDRELGVRAVEQAPVIPQLVRANRAFLGHTAGLLARKAGIRQFLDIGCGLPTRDNLAEIVRRVDPACRVAYVDNDPMVVCHARALMAVDGGVGAIEADLRDPDALLDDPELARLIDLGEPVGVFLLAVLHFITDDQDPRGIVGDLLKRLPAGSHVVISHAERTPELQAVAELYQEADVPFTPRSQEAVAELCGGLQPIGSYPAGLPLAPADRELGFGGPLPLTGFVGRKAG